MLGINARVSESDCIVWLSAASDDQGDILLARKISGNVFVFHVLYFLLFSVVLTCCKEQFLMHLFSYSRGNIHLEVVFSEVAKIIMMQFSHKIPTFMLQSEFPRRQHADKCLHPKMTKLCKSGLQKLGNVNFLHEGSYLSEYTKSFKDNKR